MRWLAGQHRRSKRLPKALVGRKVSIPRRLVNSGGGLADAAVFDDTQLSWGSLDGRAVAASGQDTGLGGGTGGGVRHCAYQPIVDRYLARKHLGDGEQEAQEGVPGGRRG